MEEQIKALEAIVEEIKKIRDKYKARAEKERAKISDVYVTVCGEKCYTDQDILDCYATDYITSKQADMYMERLERKKAKAGEQDLLTKSERALSVVDDILNNLYYELNDTKRKQRREAEKYERIKHYHELGLSYTQIQELERVTEQSEEYEKLIGMYTERR